MIRISSRRNPLLQHIKRLLRDGGYRREHGEYAADGIKLLGEALRWGAPVKTVLASDGVPLPVLPEDVELVRVPPDVMESLSLMKAPQGLLFTCALPAPAPLSFTGSVLLLDGLQDPGNLGTILRTADAMDVPAVLLEGCADPWSPKVVRASMGAVFRMALPCTSGEAAADWCEEKHIELAAAALCEGAEDARTLDLRNMAVAIGSEGRGVGPALLARAKRRLVIPMSPRCESLNAAVAAGILLWEMRRRCSDIGSG